jgi:hypothetical protein
VFEGHRPGAGCRLGAWWDVVMGRARRASVFEGRQAGAGLSRSAGEGASGINLGHQPRSAGEGTEDINLSRSAGEGASGINLVLQGKAPRTSTFCSAGEGNLGHQPFVLQVKATSGINLSFCR